MAASHHSKKMATTALFAFLTLSVPVTASTAIPASQSTATSGATWPYQTFQSTNVQPPWLNITRHFPKAESEGYFFFAPDGATEHDQAPLIMDSNGELVWNGPIGHAFNFGTYTYNGKPVLAWWNGTVFPEPIGRGNGVINIYDNTYDQIAQVTLPGDFLELTPGATYPSNIDLHELYFTSRGSILVTANNVTQANLTSVGGPADGWVVNCFVYEIEVATNKVLFSWSSLDHLDQLPFTDSLYPIGSEGFTGESQEVAWGYFHINAVEPYDGGYLISSRYFCSALAIDDAGSVKWRLQGRDGGDFKLVGSPNVTGFCYQHDVRAAAQTASTLTIHMHDNHNCPIDNGTVPTTAKALNIDFNTKEVTLQRRLINSTGPIYSTAQGNYQPLTDGNTFVGHGWIPVMEEYSSQGKILSTIQFGVAVPRPGGGFLSALAPTLSYRSFKQHWTGCPKTKPDVVAKSSAKGTTVYISWNGATDVQAWEIYGGAQKKKLALLSTVPKSRFETKATVKKVRFIEVRPKMVKGSSCKDVWKSMAVQAV